MIYGKVIEDLIDDEKKGLGHWYTEYDKTVLKKMLGEINEQYHTNFHYLAEIGAFNIHGAGSIMVRYLDLFQSESVRCYLIPQIVADKVANCAVLVLDSYLRFKESDEYIAAPGKPAPAHIYVRYDNAFKKLKPKALKKELLSLAKKPRDAFYLPFTMRMLASWKMPEMKSILMDYLDSSNITNESLGLYEDVENRFPPLTFIRRELKFTAINGLRYYPSENTLNLLSSYENDSDRDIKLAAKKSLAYIEKHSRI